ncbi:hypothetical protein [Aeoliella sp. SH292]|uniref:hypothetical protein n=1 Tax=Aeoliella sp. SH292 TaxID=3454464 RepID=UPI003F9D7B82
MTTTKYSISAANRITGKSRTTITKHLRSGRLSYEEDGQGNKLIDASELIRVYGDECDFSREEGSAPDSLIATPTGQGVQSEVNTLQSQLAKEVAERERERAHFRQQVEQLQEALKLAQEGHNKAMLLLENRTGGRGEWEATLKALEERIANQELTAKELKAAHAAKRNGGDLKDKYWWQVVFGA